MSTVIFMVRATVQADQEDAFNHWYNTEHVPQVLEHPGALSARRFKTILDDDQFPCMYVAMYEFANEASFTEFKQSEHLKQLLRDYDASFGETSERHRSAYVQIFPE